MNYLRDNKRSNKKAILTGILIVFFVYVILFTRVFDAVSGTVGIFAAPVWKTQEYIAGTWENMWSVFASKQALIDENRRLKEDNDIASVKLLDRNLLFEENIELKALLGRDITEQTIFATVLTKPSRSLYDTIIIDAGENAGVGEGDRVLYGGTIVIGKVVEVLKQSSKILLLSSPGEEIDVVVGNNNIEAVAYGRGGGMFELKLPRDTEVKIGDVATIPGLITRVLGVVEYIDTKPSDPFKTILFKGPVNIFELKWVEVVVT